MYYEFEKDGVYMNGAGWSFTVDSEIQTELTNNLNEKADNFDNKVTNMYEQINSLGDSWVGDDYDFYKTGTEGYKKALADLSDSIRMYAEHFNKMSKGTEELTTELINIVETMTTRHSEGK